MSIIKKTQRKTHHKTKGISRYTKKQSKQDTHTKTHTKTYTKTQKTLRIVFVHSPSLENDATIYKTEFLKQGYKVEFKLIDSVKISNIYYS